MKDKVKYYSYKNIDKTDTIYRLIIGERSNGKTYGYIKKVCEAMKKEGLPSAYIRRFDVEIKASKMQKLFNSIINETHEFQKIFKDEWDDVYFYGGVFYLRKYDDKHNVIDKKALLYVYALNVWERNKGADIGRVKYVCYDEFCTRDKYLEDEFIALHQTLSSIIRNRSGVIIYLIANTVNKYCPHFEEFGIGDIDNIKQGTITNFGNGIAIEYCEDTGNNSKTEYLKPFSNVQLDMLKSGAWEMKQYPHLNKTAKADTVEFIFYVNFNHKCVCGEIRQTPSGGLYIFYHYQTKPITNRSDLIKFNQVPTTNLLDSTNLLRYQPTKIHKIIYDLIKANKQFYKSNEIGELIRNWLLWQGVITG